MAIGFEQREELRKGIEARDKYKELNKKTIEVFDSYDPILKIRRFKKITIDENAKKFHVKPKPEPIKKKTNPRGRPKKKKEPVVISVKKIEKKGFVNPNSVRSRIYADYCAGMTKEELMVKYDTTSKRISVELSAKRKMLGITGNKVGVTYNKCIPLFKQGLTNTEIGNVLNIAQHTVGFHRKKYKKQLIQ